MARGTPVCHFCESEIEHLHQAGIGDHYVAGLQIAMNNAGGVGGAESVGHLHAIFQGLRGPQAAFGDQIDQGFTGDELHHHVVALGFVYDVVDGDDVGMVQTGGCLRFLNKPAAAFRITRVGAREHLHRDEPVQTRVVSFVNIAHAARAQFLQKLIMRNDPPNKFQCCPSRTYSVCHKWRTVAGGNRHFCTWARARSIRLIDFQFGG